MFKTLASQYDLIPYGSYSQKASCNPHVAALHNDHELLTFTMMNVLNPQNCVIILLQFDASYFLREIQVHALRQNRQCSGQKINPCSRYPLLLG